jgi:2-keto-4-pentenoate hydratase
METDALTLAESLVQAIRTGGSLDLDAVPQPALAEAYNIQAQILGALDIAPMGYKLSLRPDGILRAPLLSVSDAARFPFQPGLKLEVELAFRLGADLPKRETPYTRDEVADAVSTVSIGIELVRSRYQGGAQGRVPLLVADLMSTAGYLVGPRLSDTILRNGAFGEHLQVKLGDVMAFNAASAHPDGDPLQGLLSFANSGDREDSVLLAGLTMTTGSLCGGLSVPGPCAVTVDVGGAVFRFPIEA